MINRWVYWIALLSIALGAFLLRVPRLAARPMHNDEAVNAVKFNDLRTSGSFKYDPNEYHGPTLYYLTLPAAWLAGAKDFAATTEATHRIVPVIFGVGLILLFALVVDGIGRGGVLWAALFTAVSPAFVFYSRYYIHEMLLIFFAVAAIGCGWRYRRSGRIGWAIACGAMVGLTYATKETWVLGLAAAAGSAVTAATIWRLILKPVHHGLHLRPRALLAAAIAFIAVFVLCFSSFFTDLGGPWKAVTSYFHYAGRATGGDHENPWNFYLRILTWWQTPPRTGPIWTEAAIVALAVVGFLLAVFRRHTATARATAAHAAEAPAEADHPHHRFSAFPPFVRFIGFYTIFLTVGFSIIPYKTPWCLLGFLNGMILLAGFAASQIVHGMGHWALKAAVASPLLAAAAHLAWQADRATNNFAAPPKQVGRFEASSNNPYVYAHTDPDVFALLRRVDQIAAVAPKGKQLYVQVVTADCWPLPFYLRTYKQVGFWPAPPDKLDGDIIIGGDTGQLESRLNPPDTDRRYIGGWYRLRPNVRIWVYVKRDLQELWLARPR